MTTIDAYRPEDARAIAAMYRRVFGNDEAEASRLRWDWQYRRNPNCPPEGPQIWVAREGPTIIGQFGRRTALHVSGFTRQGTGPTFGQRSFWNSRSDDVDWPRPSEAPTC